MLKKNRNELDNSGSSHIPMTEAEIDEEFNPKNVKNMVEMKIGTLIAVNAEKRTCTVRMNGMPHEDVTWALPFYNTEEEIGIDYIPSTEHEEGRQALIAIDNNNNKFLISFLPRANQDNESINEDYSTGRDTDMEQNDISIKVDGTSNTGFFAKARGIVEMIVNPYLKIIADQAKKIIKITTDNFELNTPALNFNSSIEDDGTASLTFKQRSNESQADGGTMLEVVVGENIQEGHKTARTTVSLNDVVNALNNELNIDVDSGITITSNNSDISVEAANGVNIDGGQGALEQSVLGETLQDKLDELINILKNHDHQYTRDVSSDTAPVPSTSSGITANDISDIENLSAELQQILSNNVKNN